jgi:hypothetical protein
MKALKISLAAIVLAAIAFFVLKGIIITRETIPPPPPENEFTKRVEKKIDSLSHLSDRKFCKDFYGEIMYDINTYFEDRRLGETPADTSGNRQNKEHFTSNLYSTYAAKFVKQALYVFDGQEWKIDDLNFIRNEYQTLRKSKLLVKGSPVDKQFTEIQTILSKYDEIVGFISACKNFSYSNKSLGTYFPIAEIQDKISQKVTYQNKGLGNTYVNNCIRLHEELREIPQALFKAHIRYLDNKIDEFSGFYSECPSQKVYADKVYLPLKSEIDALDSDIYSVANFDREYTRLSNKWKADSQKAYEYFNKE